MLRFLSFFGLAIVTLALVSPMSTADADPINDAPGSLQPAEATPNVRRGAEFQAVKPDHVVNKNGTRIEIYTSIGNVDGGADWRPINAYSYLVANVPKYKNIYTTMYNTLWDNTKVRHNKTANRWEFSGVNASSNVFGPTEAFLQQINQYNVNANEQKKYIGVLGNRSMINKAVKEKSSLAVLSKQATRYFDCNKGGGACLTPRKGENHMHAKFSLFEQTKDSDGNLRDNVVWITSANLNGASGGSKSNTSIAVYGDAKMYEDVKSGIWHAMATKKFTAPYTSIMTKGTVPGTSGITLYPSPRVKSATWTGLRDFERDHLASTNLAGSKTDCRVYSTHSLFSRPEVRDNLAQLVNGGCDVKITLGLNSLADVSSYYFENSVQLRNLIDHVEFGNVHDKTLTTSFNRGGERFTSTFGGSANFNSTSMQYEELVFKSEDPDVTSVVERHSERVYQLARGADNAVPVSSVNLAPSQPVILGGTSLKMEASVLPSNSSVKTLTWSSDNHAVATVDTNGNVTGHAPGYANITALSVSGAKESTVNLRVLYEHDPEAPVTESPPTPTATLNVSTPPELTMSPYQSPPNLAIGVTPVVVTWSQGNIGLDGKVTLQYHSGGWKNYATIDIVNGRGAAIYKFQNSHTWRAVVSGTPTASTGQPVSLNSRAKTTAGYEHVVVRKHTSSGTLRVYAPKRVISKQNVPYLVSWKNPYAGNKGIVNQVRLQYKSGKSWKTAKTFDIPNGVVTLKVAHPATNTREWRFASGTKAVPKGVRARISSPTKVTTVK